MANTHGLRYGLTAALYALTRLPVCLAQPQIRAAANRALPMLSPKPTHP